MIVNFIFKSRELKFIGIWAFIKINKFVDYLSHNYICFAIYPEDSSCLCCLFYLQVKLLFFAKSREVAGVKEVDAVVHAETTLSLLLNEIVNIYPG